MLLLLHSLLFATMIKVHIWHGAVYSFEIKTPYTHFTWIDCQKLSNYILAKIKIHRTHTYWHSHIITSLVKTLTTNVKCLIRIKLQFSPSHIIWFGIKISTALVSPSGTAIRKLTIFVLILSSLAVLSKLRS